MDKCSLLAVRREVSGGNVFKAFYYSLHNRARKYVKSVCIATLHTVFPAPFWPVISVSGMSNLTTAFSWSAHPKLRMPERYNVDCSSRGTTSL